MGFMEKNLKEVAENASYMYDQIVRDIEKEVNEGVENIYWDYDTKKTPIIGVQRENHIYYLNSRYNQEKLIEQWCNKHIQKLYYAPIVVFGIANGQYLSRLRKENPENLIIVYEPSNNIFLENIRKTDMSDVFKNEKTFLTYGEEGLSYFGQLLIAMIGTVNIEYTDLCALPNYESAYPLEFLKFRRVFYEMMEGIVFDKNTRTRFDGKIQRNFYENFRDILAQYSLKNYLDAFHEENNTKDIPAIIISAGPSLDKNIDQIKKAEGKAFIIVVDSAVKPVLKHKIVPNIVVTIDANKNIDVFKTEGIEKIPMLMDTSSNAEIKSIHKGIHIYMYREEAYMHEICKKYHKTEISLATGGSVANDAFALACKLGFRKIILVGQDLAFPGNRGHATDSMNEPIIPGKTPGVFMEVEDIYGKPVLTRGDMNRYRRWFEQMIACTPQVSVIDATEGGAKIMGTEIMTLEDAIKRECKKNHDFSNVCNHMVPAFTKEERKKIYVEIIQIKQKLLEVKNKLKMGIELYNKLEVTNEKKGENGDEIRRIYKKIKKFNEWLEEDYVILMLASFANETEFEIQKNIYEECETTHDEINLIAKNGKKMINDYIKNIPLLIENIELIEREEVNE